VGSPAAPLGGGAAALFSCKSIKLTRYYILINYFLNFCSGVARDRSYHQFSVFILVYGDGARSPPQLNAHFGVGRVKTESGVHTFFGFSFQPVLFCFVNGCTSTPATHSSWSMSEAEAPLHSIVATPHAIKTRTLKMPSVEDLPEADEAAFDEALDNDQDDDTGAAIASVVVKVRSADDERATNQLECGPHYVTGAKWLPSLDVVSADPPDLPLTITKINLATDGSAFVLRNFLSAAECLHLIAEAEEVGAPSTTHPPSPLIWISMVPFAAFTLPKLAHSIAAAFATVK
jgi:hypothetical protein